MTWFRKRRCPHTHLIGVYGDGIFILGTRLICEDCGRYVDGPVALVELRRAEAEALAYYESERP